jgi:hypothetical protein
LSWFATTLTRFAATPCRPVIPHDARESPPAARLQQKFHGRGMNALTPWDDVCHRQVENRLVPARHAGAR